MPARQLRQPPKPRLWRPGEPLPERQDDPWAELADLVLCMRPQELEQFAEELPPDDVSVLEDVLARHLDAGWRAHPAAMAHHLTDGEYQLWPYVELLSLAWVAGIRGIEPRQMWQIASQYGKTTLVLWGIIWALDQNPRLRFMYVSYSAEKAEEESGRALDLVREHQSHLRFRLRRDRQQKGVWRTEQGGGLYAVGVGGSITGFPADAVVGDDLLKGWQAGHSETQRQTAWSIYTSQMRMRVQSQRNPIYLVGTRWHEDDPQGRAEAAQSDPEADRWRIIRLPTVAEPTDEEPDPLGRERGQILEPRRFPEAEVRARRAALGPYLFAAMEQQRPAPEEGGDIKRGWWRWEEALPARYDATLFSWDMKLKDKETGDYVVGQAWGRVGADFYLFDQVRGQWNFATSKVAVALMHVRHPEVRRHVIENTGNGPEVMAELRRANPKWKLDDEVAGALGITEDERAAVEAAVRRGIPGLVPNNPKGDKTVRVRAVTPIIEAGNVHLPLRDAPWAEGVVEECAVFPNGLHDDQVDTVTQALLRLTKGPGKAKAARRDMGKPRPGATVAPASRGRASVGRSLARPPVRR